MTISTTASSVRAQGNGAQTVFSYSFPIPSGAGYALYLVDALGNITTLGPSVYSINGIGSANGGSFTYPLAGGTPVAAGNWLVLVRGVPDQQNTALSNQGPYLPQVVELGLDWLEMQIQQNSNELTQTLRAPPADVAMNLLPTAVARANQYLAFDANGQPIVTVGPSTGAAVSAAILPVVEAATLDAGRIAFGAGATGDTLFQSATPESARTTLGVIPRGVVTMERINGVWTVFNPDGSLIDISASTTDGAQEAFNAACTPPGTPGYDLEIIGGNETAFGAYNITCTTPIVVRPMQGKKIRIGAVSFNFSPAVTGPGFTFDSMEMFDVEFAHGAQITYSGPAHTDGPALLIQPKNGTPGDGIIAVTSGKFRAPAIAVAGAAVSTDHVVQLDCTFGTIGSCEFDLSEVNGAGNSNTSPASAVGVYIPDPGAGKSFIGNTVKIGQIHEVNTSGLSIGSTAASNSAITGNIFIVGSIGTAGSAATHGIDLWGSDNTIICGDIDFVAGTGSLFLYLDINPGANGNVVQIGKVNASATYSDSGTDNVITVAGVVVNSKNIAASAGHHRLPDGTWENWGNVSIPGTSSVVVTFDKAFPNGFLNAQLSTNSGPSSGLASPSWNAQSATGFTIFNNNGGTQQIYYRVLGY